MHSSEFYYLQSLFHHPVVREKYSIYNELWLKNTSFPYFNYFGINFSNKGIVSVKFYFHVFQKVDKNEAELFLPFTDDFFSYYHLYEPSEIITTSESGCAFEVKFRGNENPILGFHYRLKPGKAAYDLIGYPQLLPFDVLTLDTKPGINYEYSENVILRKQYYYFHNLQHKKYFADRFGFEFLNTAELIEYSEAKTFSKINTWYGVNEKFMLPRSPFKENENRLIDEICSTFGLKCSAFGYYENKEIRAAYFFAISSEKPSGVVKDSTDYYSDTLKFLL